MPAARRLGLCHFLGSKPLRKGSGGINPARAHAMRKLQKNPRRATKSVALSFNAWKFPKG